MAQPRTRSPVVGGKTDWGIATGTGHLEPDRYPPANGTQREGNCRMDSCQSERYGATSFIAAGSLARATRASAGGSPRHFRSHLLAPNIGASIRCCCSANTWWCATHCLALGSRSCSCRGRTHDGAADPLHPILAHWPACTPQILHLFSSFSYPLGVDLLSALSAFKPALIKASEATRWLAEPKLKWKSWFSTSTLLSDERLVERDLVFLPTAALARRCQ